MFNTFVWQLYTESERGKKVLERCSSFSNALHDDAFSTPFFGLSSDDLGVEYPKTDSDSTELICAARDFAAKVHISDLEQATALFDQLIFTGLSVRFSGEAEATPFGPEDMTADIQHISIGLHLAHPEYFIPYGFVTLFDYLQRIAEMFSLALPPIPGKKDAEGRGRYYAQLNRAFHEFRGSYGLSVVETCAFLYDFAPKCLAEDDEMPEPSKVWLVTGGAGNNGDFEWLEEVVGNDLSASHWQGNLETRRGDILLMYCVTPHSCIHSIWRAVSDGFTDPFFYYHSTIWVGQPIKIVPVTFKEMKADSLLSQKGEIRAHLQGPSGKPFTLEEYEAVLAIMARKGQDITRLPKPQTVISLLNTKLSNERDVEINLIEPLLSRLGYSEKDWLRQMRLRMGRGERIYPDYVFGANITRGEEEADMVLEAKFTISGEKAREDAYFQAASYAYRLRAKIVLLAAREGVWLFEQKRKSFALERFTFYGWDALQHPDTLFQLKKTLVKPRR